MLSVIVRTVSAGLQAAAETGDWRDECTGYVPKIDIAMFVPATVLVVAISPYARPPVTYASTVGIAVEPIRPQTVPNPVQLLADVAGYRKSRGPSGV